jgi:serine/threonine-protein kinase
MSETKSDKGSPYPKAGEVLEGKYEIQRVLGQGAMGAVMRATHKLRKAPVALKFMSPDVMDKPGIVDRFLNEGVAASRIDSEHVVTVYDVSKMPSGVPYMVMEYLEGEDLEELLESEGTPWIQDIPRCIYFVLQVLRGLQVAHRVGIVHRDLKPANCFVVTKDGQPDFVKIVDFGISKLEQDDGVELTQAGSALGTPLYMSPEQARNPKGVDARTDIYSAAVILYELLGGRPPFIPESGTISELFMMLATADPPPLTDIRPDLPPGLWDVVRYGMQKKPDERFQTVAHLAEALAPYADWRSDHVLQQMLRRAPGGESRYPPPPGVPTLVDTHQHGERPSAPGYGQGADTTNDPDARPPGYVTNVERTRQGMPMPGSMVPATAQSPTDGSRPGAATATPAVVVVSDAGSRTQAEVAAALGGQKDSLLGVANTVDGTIDRVAPTVPMGPAKKGMSPALLVGAVVAVGGLGVLAWAFSQGDQDAAAQPPITTTAESPVPPSEPSAATTAEPSATAVASASAEAAASATSAASASASSVPTPKTVATSRPVPRATATTTATRAPKRSDVDISE